MDVASWEARKGNPSNLGATIHNWPPRLRWCVIGSAKDTELADFALGYFARLQDTKVCRFHPFA